jgi:tetratricopeptide (TPR) repeat protein
LICKLFLFLFLSIGLFGGQQSGLSESLDAAHRAELSRDLPRAESIYQRLLAGHPDADVYQRLGLVRHLQNKFGEASQAFEQALRLNPQLWSSHLFLGIDYYRMNRFSEALKQLETADRLHPEQGETRFWLGATQLALRHYMQGFEVLESVLEKDPNNTEVLRLLAESYAGYGTQLLNQVGEKYPDTAAGLEVQGRAFEFEGSYEAALRAYREAAAKDPERPGIREAIARVLRRNAPEQN